jgi:dihydrofolate reductase
MRNLVFAINTTLDGCCDHTRFSPDEETMDYFTRLTRDTDTFLYGRKIYELMVPYWPDVAKAASDNNDTGADIEFAKAFDAVSKMVVFSTSLEKVADKKTKIVRAGLREETLKLKQENGKNIMTGGVNIASQLAELGLIDEYHFVVHPIIIGEGRRVFDGINIADKLQLKFVDSITFRSGVMALRYLKNEDTE